MTIEAACPCGARFHAESHLAGQVVACPSCGQAFQVPKPEPHLIQVQCHCGKSYRVKGVLAGKKVQCAACGQSFVAQAISGNVLRTPTAPAAGVNPFGPAPGGAVGGGLDVGGLDMSGMGIGGMGVPQDPLGGFGAPTGGFGAPTGGFAPAMGAPAYAPQPAYPQPSPQAYGQPYGGGAKRSMSGPSGKTLLWIGGGMGAVAVLAVVVVLGVLFLPDLMSGLLGGGKSSPEAAFAAFQSAARAEDFAKIYDILAPKERERLLARLVLMASLTSKADAEAAEVLNKHGIKLEEMLPAMGVANPMAMLGMEDNLAKVESHIASKTSPRRLFNDLAVMARRKTSERGRDRFSDQLLKEGTLGNVTVTGEQATGAIQFSQNGLNRDGQVRFVRHEGSWYVSLSAL
ncbi:MAG: hypothetical protein U1A77_21925 [Pirellulales bacterium]